jgi:signal transduction histidine kinase/CheY-like chemotaxis protein
VTQAEYGLRRKDTGETWVGSYSFGPIRDRHGFIVGSVVTARDITAQRLAEVQTAKLEAQLQQAQKMESVGRLAGGVAHDFNNMLAVILGNTEEAMEQVDPSSRLHEDLEEVRKAATRSADLTRQLLAFARRQTVTPKVLDLNHTVSNILAMLGRLLGETVHVAWLPDERLWPVRMDPSQLDQTLTNLCLNARDAMAGGGKVTVETANAQIDGAYCAAHEGAVTGDYVRLSVSDTGRGMDAETLSHVFEPFFTTKEVGKGTGLGLATVYGVVKQNKGFLDVSSELGKGTTFTIYLPRHAGDRAQGAVNQVPEAAPRGTETVLLVEDEAAVLRLAKKVLERFGHTVLNAANAAEAIALAERHSGEIHLLMTDVVMPEMNGRELARTLLSRYPRLKCLFMSGYTADVIAEHGVVEGGVNFLQKPFSTGDLAAKVRQVLDGKAAT